MSSVFKGLVSQATVVLDIGANLGLYTLLSARAGAQVYAFEPDPRTLPFLVGNIERNGLSDRVIVVPKAVSDSDGIETLELHRDPAQSGLFPRHSSGQVVTIESIRLDTFLKEKNQVDVDVIKLDIEGAELRALDGMKKTIASYVGRLVMFVECYPLGLQAAGGSTSELLNQLNGLGFAVAAIDEEKDRFLFPTPPDL